MDTNPAKKKFSLKNKYITKREIIIAAVVAVVIFLIVCDKPMFEDGFTLWKPYLWSTQKLSSGDVIINISKAGASDDAVDLDKVVICDKSSELNDEIQTAKDYITYRINYEVEYSMEEVPPDKTSEQVQIFETGRLNFGGYDVYYFIYTPGGEYSGNKTLEVAIRKGDKLYTAEYRSRWMNFDNNYKKAFKMIKTIRIK